MRPIIIAAALASALAVGIGAAAADTMHPELGARLAGMGEHGIVNFQSHATTGKLCWTFELTTDRHHGCIDPRYARDDRGEARLAVRCEGLRDREQEGALADRVEAAPVRRVGRHEGPPRRRSAACCSPAWRTCDEARRTRRHAQDTDAASSRDRRRRAVVARAGERRRGARSPASCRRSLGRSRRSCRRRAGASTRSPTTCRPSTRRRGVCGSAASCRSPSRCRTSRCARCRAPSRSRRSTASPGWTVQNVHWAGVRLTDVFDVVKPLPEAQRAPVRLRGGSVRRLPHDAAVALEGRDARLRDGRQAAPA